MKKKLQTTMRTADKIPLNQNSNGAAIHLNIKIIRQILSDLQALNHPVRAEMLKLLIQKKQMTVTEIYSALNIEQSMASQHLSTLKNAGIVKAERNGKFVMYKVQNEMIDKLNTFIKTFG